MQHALNHSWMVGDIILFVLQSSIKKQLISEIHYFFIKYLLEIIPKCLCTTYNMPSIM